MLAQGAFAEAAAELERALDLWRGDVLADLAHLRSSRRLPADWRKFGFAASESKIEPPLCICQISTGLMRIKRRGHHAFTRSGVSQFKDHVSLPEGVGAARC